MKNNSVALIVFLPWCFAVEAQNIPHNNPVPGEWDVVSKEPIKNPRAQSYTIEKIRQMAGDFQLIRERKIHLSDDNLLEYITVNINASEFKGYVAAILDEAPKHAECTRKYTLNDIVYRTAIGVISIPLNRTDIAAINVHISVYLACDLSRWKMKNNLRNLK